MSLLRIYCNLLDAPLRCQWALSNGERNSVTGETPLAGLPPHARRVQLVIPAAQVLIMRARLPQGAKRHSGAMLAFAVEEKTLGEPDAQQVSCLGSAGGDSVLAVIDRKGLARWLDALDAAGIQGCEVQSETLLLPWVAGQWSLAWNGGEGFVRTGEYEGAATDCGDRESPPLSLRLMLEETRANGTAPTAITLYATAQDAAPNVEAWQRELGVNVQLAGSWDWRNAPADAGVSLAQERRRWRAFFGTPAGTLARLRPAAWIAGIALAIHAVFLVADWVGLHSEQRALRRQMDSRFRAAFPEAVAVVDPALQMRRKLAEARHAAGLADSGDFPPMIVAVAGALKELPAGSLRVVSYEGGRMTLELAATEAASVRRISDRLLQAGLSVDTSPTATNGMTVITLRAL